MLKPQPNRRLWTIDRSEGGGSARELDHGKWLGLFLRLIGAAASSSASRCLAQSSI
jgi:hypothetical protein